MAEKLDNLDVEIERELQNLSLDELSTSDVDSVADVGHSLPNSPAKDSYGDVLGDYIKLMKKTHSDLDLLHNQSRDYLKLTEKAMLDTSKLKTELDNEAALKEEVDDGCFVVKQDRIAVIPVNNSPSQYRHTAGEILSCTISPTSNKASVEHAESCLAQDYHHQNAMLHHLEVERKEKELLAEEQRNINEKLKAIEKEQLQYYENAKRAEAQLKEEKLQKQIKAAVILQAFWRRFRVWSIYQPKLKVLKELRLRKKSEEKTQRFKKRCRAAVVIQKYWRGYKVWSIYQLKLKSLKELQLKKKLEEKSKLEELKKKSKAAIIIQKYWRGYRVKKLYGAKLKELKQKRILSKLKKINEKRRKYHSVSTEGKLSSSGSDNSAVNIETTTINITSIKIAQNHEDQKNMKLFDTSEQCEALDYVTSSGSESALAQNNDHEGVIMQNSISTVSIPSNTVSKDGEGPKSDNPTKVIKLCCSPVRINDAIKAEVHKLLQEEKSRNAKVECPEQCCKPLKLQSNFETGLLNLQNPVNEGFVKRHSSSSPVSSSTLSPSSSSNAVFTSPSVSCKASGVLLESDEDDSISKELKILDAIVASKHEEELIAKKSRKRMLKAYSVEKSSNTSLSRTKKSIIDYVTAEISPMVWNGLIEERRKKWLLNHSLWKNTEAPLLTQKFRSLRTFNNNCNEQIGSARSQSSECIKRPLSDFQLLSASPRGTKLEQVIQVNVFKAKHEVDLSCLSKCPCLISLNLTKCTIPSFSGFVRNDQLVEICAQSNSTDSMDCKGLSNLMFLDIACNKLSSLQGLKDLQQLLELNLSENRLTRIAHLEDCKSLEKLILDGNLLVNSEGLLSLPNLQLLSLVGNHLTKLDSIDNCCLLQYCYLQENNIQEFPKVINSPLLREIHLEQNNLDNVEAFSSAYLPLLEVLDVNGNCISHLEPMSTFVMLHTLNVSNNCISDLSEFLQSLKACYEIKHLIVDGNPVIEEVYFKSSIKKVLPKLKYLGEEEILNQERTSAVPVNLFVEVCKKQISEQNSLSNKHSREMERLSNLEDDSPAALVELLRTKFYQSKERCSLLTEHLWQHEYFESDKAKELLLQHTRKHSMNLRSLETNLRSDKQSNAAITIQACWRGRRVRKWLKYNSPRWLAAVCIQSHWRGYCVRMKLRNQLVWLHVKEAKIKTMHKVATRIQAYYRGYRLRKRLEAILEQAKYTDEGESDDFDYSQDVVIQELDENVFNSCLKSPDINESFEKNESLLSSSNSPLLQENDTKFLRSTDCNNVPKPESPNMSGDYYKTRNRLLDNQSVQSFEETLYLGMSKPAEYSNDNCTDEKITDLAQENVENDDIQTVESEVTKIAEEWGFKDIATAEMMMKKVKKHKQPHANTVKAKKMADPKVRLAQFKAKQEEPVTVKCIHCRERNRKEYFKSRQMVTTTPPPNYEGKKDFVYKWVDNQNLFHETFEIPKSAKPSVGKLLSREKNSQILKQQSEVINEASGSLPYLEPHVLAGHVPRLVTSEVQNELARHSSVGAIDKTKIIPQHLCNKVKSSSSPDMFELHNTQDTKKFPHR